jgi:hypothetical protein
MQIVPVDVSLLTPCAALLAGNVDVDIDDLPIGMERILIVAADPLTGNEGDGVECVLCHDHRLRLPNGF